jgi:hypothetical protein
MENNFGMGLRMRLEAEVKIDIWEDIFSVNKIGIF